MKSLLSSAAWKISIFSIIACIFIAHAKAAPMIYEFSGTISGTIGSTAFSQAAFSIKVYADTDNIASNGSGFFSVEDDYSTLEISGIGLAIFSLGERVYFSNAITMAGFAQSESRDGLDLMDVFCFEAPYYDLSTPFGPYTSEPFIVQFIDEPTSLGNVSLYDAEATFTATPVPEPSTAVLGFVGIGMCAIRRRRVLQAR